MRTTVCFLQTAESRLWGVHRRDGDGAPSIQGDRAIPKDFSLGNVPEMIAHQRRRRTEAQLSRGAGELAIILLPLALTEARLTARADVVRSLDD